MPFTTFPAFATNYLWTAADHSTYLKDNINYLIGTAEPTLTNKSGGILSAGAVVVPYASTDNAFTTTTTAGATVLGVLMENNIADASSGRVAVNGVVTINVQGNVTRGNYLAASSTAGRAADAGPTQAAGAFAVALTGYAGGAAGTVTGLLLKSFGYGFGLAVKIYPLGVGPASISGAVAQTLAAVSAGNGGAVAFPIAIPAVMVVDSLTFRAWNGSSTARTGEWRLYRDTGSATLAEVSGVNGTFSYTDAPAAGTLVVTSTTCGVTVAPGLYWIVLRNTHATNALYYHADAADVFGSNVAQTQAIAALGATIDLVTGWSKITYMPTMRLNGRVMGQASAY